ncbi:MAG: DNA repair exonuclease [Gammaproteobacteria bacterium]|nr:DNA repair exonuclease [Gammaproteobacteria bacterium]
MAIRVVFFSDSHLGFDYPVRPRSDRARRGPDFFANFQRVLDHARHTRADLVIHGGDFFFSRKVDSSIVDTAYTSLLEFARSGIPIAIVPGNHEGSVLPPSLFLNHPDIHVFDRPRTFRFDIKNERLVVSGFPYLRNVRVGFSTAVRACGNDQQQADYRLLCFHHAVEGAVVGPGNFTFREAGDVIARDDLPTGFDAILSGHIHRHQVLAYPTPVVYCGSIERTSFAEKNEAKGFCELTLHRASPIPRLVFHELPARPMIDFDGRGYRQAAKLLDDFARRSSHWQIDAIVRLRLKSYPERRLRRELERLAPGILNISCPYPRSRAAG